MVQISNLYMSVGIVPNSMNSLPNGREKLDNEVLLYYLHDNLHHIVLGTFSWGQGYLSK